LTAPDPQRLTDLGKRLDELQTKQAGVRRAPPSQSGNATRVAAELVGGLFVGGGIGWGTDRHLSHRALGHGGVFHNWARPPAFAA